MSTDRYTQVSKPGTFLAHYLHYMSELETPRAYDFWAGMWLLSTAVSRDVYVARPGAPVYLNLYTILCANSGATRKSTAVRRAERVYNALRLGERRHVINNKTTPEGLLTSLSDMTTNGMPAHADFIVSEMVTVFGKETYAAALPGILTDLYDCPSERTARSAKGNHVMRDVYITLLTASTPTWLLKAINPDIIEGGFTSRCLYIMEEKSKRRVAWPSIEDDDDRLSAATAALERIISTIHSMSISSIDITPMAKSIFIKWYNNRSLNSEGDAYATSFEAREDHHILRCAALLACNDMSFIINAFHIKQAIRLIGTIKRDGNALFGNQSVNVKIAAGFERLRSIFIEAGAAGITQTELNYKMRYAFSNDILRYALTIMHELQLVSKFEEATIGRPKIIWRGNDKLLSPHMWNLALDRMSSE